LGNDKPTEKDQLWEKLNTLIDETFPKPKRQVLVYIVGDTTSDGSIILNEEKSQAVSPKELFDHLEPQKNKTEIVLVVDCPLAGVFIEENKNRSSFQHIVVAGTSRIGTGIFIPRENHNEPTISFSQLFFNCTSQGYSLKESFNRAKDLLTNEFGETSPELDDNGDGISNKEDGHLSNDQYLGRLRFIEESLSTLLDACRFKAAVREPVYIWVDVKRAATPKRVWTRMIPRGETKSGDHTFPEFDLKKEGESWRWSRILQKSDFPSSGKYTLIFYAQYADGQISEPIITQIDYDGVGIQNWSKF